MPARSDPNSLGEYLRARRELVDPAAVGLRVTGVRRTPGLRREEVATLAGISADYYLRLEQGRDRHPSAQVLTALARVFDLDPDATAYLLSLAEPQAPAARRAMPHTPRSQVPPRAARSSRRPPFPSFVAASVSVPPERCYPFSRHHNGRAGPKRAVR